MTDARSPQQGQIIVLLALALVAMVAMTGLVIDGGSAYAQRRGQQNAADLAALAGADALINGADTTQAATDVATANGYTTGGDTTVTVTTSPAAGTVKVDIKAPHRNHFAGVVGMPTWDVTVTATAIGGVPTRVRGAAPIIFSEEAFDPDNNGLPYDEYGCAQEPCTPAEFGDRNGDVPNNAGDIAWTVYGPNVNTGNCNSPGDNRVKCYLAGLSVLNESFEVGDYIGQMNGGYHNALFGDGNGVYNSAACDDGKSADTNVDTCLSGKNVVVPIVSPEGTTCNGGEDGGCFVGWALFHVVSAEGSNEKTLKGYFVTGIDRGGSGTDVCTEGPDCEGFRGLYVVTLIN